MLNTVMTSFAGAVTGAGSPLANSGFDADNSQGSVLTVATVTPSPTDATTSPDIMTTSSGTIKH